ncbi:polysaccharide pyruvyl transferase family protein [Leuconostoc mesenteroides]|uniref:polysaccharide pyruvyl transferase family protein n=1 Tax=Leuconostoc mesenteroides TaxID=1245 RepID=UPI001E539BE0|nr:polysaccharide pyruvyl transferase family protein [Leuconostoc mesenteroides]
MGSKLINFLLVPFYTYIITEVEFGTIDLLTTNINMLLLIVTLSTLLEINTLNSKLQEFSSSKIVITDRLHGMIVAYITGALAIVFDNQNNKVRHSYNDWLSDVDYIHFVADDYSNEELEKLITKYASTSNFMGKVSGLVHNSSYAKLIGAFQLNKL